MYDISTWTSHPGGRVIYSAAGQDATDSFMAFHSGSAHGMLEEFHIGSLDGATPAGGKPALSPFEADYRKLYATIKAEGLMKAK